MTSPSMPEPAEPYAELEAAFFDELEARGVSLAGDARADVVDTLKQFYKISIGHYLRDEMAAHPAVNPFVDDAVYRARMHVLVRQVATSLVPTRPEVFSHSMTALRRFGTDVASDPNIHDRAWAKKILACGLR